MLTEKILRAGRVTRYLPWLRGLEIVRRGYRAAISRPEGWTLRVDDFDGDIKLDVDPRECVGITVWHRPEIFEKRERELFCRYTRPGAVVLDVGANIGIYSLLAAKRGAQVFAIEADPQNAARLRRHVEINHQESRISVFEFAAVDKCGTTLIFRNPINCGGSNCFDGIDQSEIRASTIDSLNLPAISICKMDIEGAEGRAIVGMRETIRRSPEFKLCIEYNPTLSFGDCSLLADLLHAIFQEIHVIGGAPLKAGEHPSGFCDLFCANVRQRIDWDRVAQIAHALNTMTVNPSGASM